MFPGSFLDSSSSLLTVAACTALGEIGRNGALLVPADGEGFTKLSIVHNLLARIPSGKESTKVSREVLWGEVHQWLSGSLGYVSPWRPAPSVLALAL